MTVWQDPRTDEAYLIFATDNNANLAIASLDSDYTNSVAILSNFTNVFWEAPGVFKHEANFYLLVSPQDSWTPTANLWMTSQSMSGPWTVAKDLAPPDAFTYLTQNTYEIVVEGTERTTYVYLGDRWNGHALYSSTYSFMPLILDGGNLSIHNTGGWQLDVETGVWSDLPYEHIPAASSTSTQLVPCDSGCFGGQAANMTNTNEFSFIWNGSEGSKIVQIEYSYIGGKNSFLHIGASVDNITDGGSALLESSMVDFVQQTPLPLSLETGSLVVLKLLDWDGDEVLLAGVKVFDLERGSSVLP